MEEKKGIKVFSQMDSRKSRRTTTKPNAERHIHTESSDLQSSKNIHFHTGRVT